jgi:hypothetical protein
MRVNPGLTDATKRVIPGLRYAAQRLNPGLTHTAKRTKSVPVSYLPYSYVHVQGSPVRGCTHAGEASLESTLTLESTQGVLESQPTVHTCRRKSQPRNQTRSGQSPPRAHAAGSRESQPHRSHMQQRESAQGSHTQHRKLTQGFPVPYLPCIIR